MIPNTRSGRSRRKLKTICVEAVRHAIANMTIDDALKEQLRKFEDRWGILFDQVGIEKVRIMSEKLFEDLQSEYRDELCLSVSRARIQTDRTIAGEQNVTRELTETERMETGFERIRTSITESKLEPVRTRRMIEQTFTPEHLSHELISALPQIYEALEIDNYSVMNTGPDGTISPICQVMQEVIGLLRANNLEDLLRRGGSSPGAGSGTSNE